LIEYFYAVKTRKKHDGKDSQQRSPKDFAIERKEK
jgi:hypothetical protein